MKDILYFFKQIHLYTGKKLYFNLIAITFIGLLQGISTLLLITLINTIDIIDLGIKNESYLAIISILDRIPSEFVLPLILIIYLIVALGTNYLNKVIAIRNGVIQIGFLRKLRTETYFAIFRASWSFFLKYRKSDLVNIVDSKVGEVGFGIQSVLSLFSSLIFMLIQVLIAFALSPVITTFVIICGLFLVILNRKFLKKSYALGNLNYELRKEYFAGMTDQLNGIKDIKSNSLEEKRLNWFLGITKQIEDEQIAYLTLKNTSQLYYKSSSALFIAVFIYTSYLLFQPQAGQLILIILIFSRLWPQVTSIHSSLEYIATELPSLKVVKDIQEECKALVEFQDGDLNNVKPLRLQRAIECRNVNFNYNTEQEYPALKNINLTIRANEITAIVGKSGAGKSTLIDLLMGLNKPDTGEVLVDGVPMTDQNLLGLRQVLSYVPQDPFLFNTSIRENLTLANENASIEEIWAALTFANAADFVKKLPEGIETLIGDRGIKLSGGERQRLVLARAILKKPSILILDEATSALDSESEQKIQEAIESLKGKMTVIVIAHRLSTIRNADQIIVIEDGQVIQQGGFNQLVKEEQKLFRKLLSKQQFDVVSL